MTRNSDGRQEERATASYRPKIRHCTRNGNIECQQSSIDFRLRSRYVDEQATDLDDALARIAKYTSEGLSLIHI